MTGEEKQVLARLLADMTPGERAEAELFTTFGGGHFARDAALRYLRTGELPDTRYERVVALRLALAAVEAVPAAQRPSFADPFWDHAMLGVSP